MVSAGLSGLHEVVWMTYHTDAWSAGARGAVTKWWICRTTGFAACTRGPARMIAFVDLALALMPPRGRNDDPAFPT